jgi:transposase
MPDPVELHAVVHDGRTLLMVGGVVLAAFDNEDVGMRNLALVSLTEMGLPVHAVSRLVGLTPEYGSELRGQVRREGSARLVRRPGRPSKLTEAQVRQARAWKAAGVLEAEIARRLKVAHKTVTRAVGGVEVAVQPEMDLAVVDAGVEESAAVPAMESVGGLGAVADSSSASGPAVDGGGGHEATARIGTGSVMTRYAGATLLYPFMSQVGAEQILRTAAGVGHTDPAGLRFDDLAVLTVTSVVFGLGFASLEQAKHPDRCQVGPVAGIEVLPELRTLRPRLAAIADGCDPLGLQRSLAEAMLRVEPNLSGVYFVDEHFMPYSGAKPVGSGWNTKRRHAEPGRVDTTICDPKGRTVCFTSGEPSGLSTSLPATLAQLRRIVGEATPILLGFDRGGAYPTVFKACRAAGAHWITYRRAPLAVSTRLPIHTTITHPRREPTTIAYAEETVQIKDYGPARQITLFEHGKPVLQILTSDTTTCPTALILFMRARWRIENLFKYLDFYGIDYLTDYHATINPDTHKVNNPQRKKLKAELAELTADRDRHRERIGAAHTDRTLTVNQINQQSVAAQRRIHALDRQIADLTDQLRTIPAKIPANQLNPDATRAVHRTHRRALQMVLRLLAANAENWLAHHLNAYLQDNDEYRATTRNLLHLGGTINYTNTTITVELDQPNTPRLSRALALLLDEINQLDAHIPGDPRPLTYTLKPRST